jgi:hypothetical protein
MPISYSYSDALARTWESADKTTWLVSGLRNRAAPIQQHQFNMNELNCSPQALAAPDVAAAEGTHVPMPASILSGLRNPAIAFHESRRFEQ